MTMYIIHRRWNSIHWFKKPLCGSPNFFDELRRRVPAGK